MAVTINGMTFLTERREIAKAINIDQIPVLTMDIEHEMLGYEHCYQGSKAVVDDGKLGIRCTLEMFGDQENEEYHNFPHMYRRIVLMPETICLDNSFGKHDAEEMIEWRQAMRIKEGQKVIVYFSKGDEAMLRLMKVGKCKEFVYPTAVLEDVGVDD